MSKDHCDNFNLKLMESYVLLVEIVKYRQWLPHWQQNTFLVIIFKLLWYCIVNFPVPVPNFIRTFMINDYNWMSKINVHIYFLIYLPVFNCLFNFVLMFQQHFVHLAGPINSWIREFCAYLYKIQRSRKKELLSTIKRPAKNTKQGQTYWCDACR